MQLEGRSRMKVVLVSLSTIATSFWSSVGLGGSSASSVISGFFFFFSGLSCGASATGPEIVSGSFSSGSSSLNGAFVGVVVPSLLHPDLLKAAEEELSSLSLLSRLRGESEPVCCCTTVGSISRRLTGVASKPVSGSITTIAWLCPPPAWLVDMPDFRELCAPMRDERCVDFIFVLDAMLEDEERLEFECFDGPPTLDFLIADDMLNSLDATDLFLIWDLGCC
mmetsp:Transcript_5976/g.13862  ORF Transcript_5976/g.13862 Transcript_5976/m.13862 type:complete len:223 (+) Transcript_5976:1651-2319(+)